MVKRNHKPQAHRPKDVTQSERTNLSVLRQELELWYRLHVLLYDLENVANDPSSEKRICSTTNELYISEPYFTDSEAIRIRTAIVDDGILDNNNNNNNNTDEVIDDAATNVAVAEAEEEEEEGTTTVSKSDSTSSTLNKDATVEEVIHTRLSNFFDKRKASGDARPCGPHDMLPIYLKVFGVGKERLKDDRFLSRLRRSGLDDFRSGEGNIGAEDQSMERGKGKKRGKNDN